MRVAFWASLLVCMPVVVLPAAHGSMFRTRNMPSPGYGVGSSLLEEGVGREAAKSVSARRGSSSSRHQSPHAQRYLDAASGVDTFGSPTHKYWATRAAFDANYYTSLGGVHLATGALRLHKNAVPLSPTWKDERCGWTFYTSLLEETLALATNLRGTAAALEQRRTQCMDGAVAVDLNHLVAQVEDLQVRR